MNLRIVDGFLTKNAEVKVANGTKFLALCIANNEFVKGEKVTTFFNVVSYDTHDIEKVDKFTKGCLIIVTGSANEKIAIQNGKAYLNRNILAHHIEKGTPYMNKEKAPISEHHSSVPVSATCEIPNQHTPKQTYQAEIPTVTMPTITNQDDDDGLPF